MTWLKRIFTDWRLWMRDKRVPLKVLVEVGLRKRVEQAAKQEGITMAALVARTLEQVLIPAAQPVKATTGQVLMEAAFAALDTSAEPLYPGVIPLPPAAAPKAEMPTSAPSISNPRPPVTTAAPFMGHSCIHLRPGGTAQYSRDQIQGTCSAQSGKVCHWASHVAKNCTMFQSRRVMTAPMQAFR